MKPEVILEVRNASVQIGEKSLLKDLSFIVRTGEFISVRGQSGIGKTTLLRALAGLISFSAGEVMFHGTSPEKTACPDGKRQGMPAYRRRVMLVEQQPVLIGDSIEDCLSRPFSFRVNRREKFNSNLMLELFKRIGLGKVDVSGSVEELSVGQKQRISLVRALLLQPEILLLDEPTSALDENAERQTEIILREYAEQGMSALIVTHDPAQAERLCHGSLELSRFVVADLSEVSQ